MKLVTERSSGFSPTDEFRGSLADMMAERLNWPTSRLSVNLSTVYSHLRWEQRVAAAVADGFAVVESWWPFPGAEPRFSDVSRLTGHFLDADVEVASLNFFTGDRSMGQRGLPADACGLDTFLANVPVALEVAQKIGAKCMNLLYGNANPAERPSAQLHRAASVIAHAASMAEARGIKVMIEPLSRSVAELYALRTVKAVLEVIDAVSEAGGPPVGVCFDVYHLAQEDPDALERIGRYIDLIYHVQMADCPGRGAPGTGGLPLSHIVSRVRDAGYGGTIGLEYFAPVQET